jgi:hypothetical protein
MIEKENNQFAVTRLTRYGYDKILNNNEEFDITHYALIDDEINYNLINDDQNIAKGFGRIDPNENDIIQDIQSQAMMDVPTRIDEVGNFLFGEFNKHFLLPDKIKNEVDLYIDMQGTPINLDNESFSSKKEKKVEFESEIISGNFPTQKLTKQDLKNYSAFVLIHGIIKFFDETQMLEVELGEELNPFSLLEYNITFNSSIDPKYNFSYTKIKNVSEAYELSIKNITSEFKLSYDLYGTFSIFKRFIFEGKEYFSNTYKIELVEPEIQSQNFDTSYKDMAMDIYSDIYQKKNIFINFDFENNKIQNKVYGKFSNDVIKDQPRIDGYISLKNPITFTAQISAVNSLNLYLQNVNNKTNVNFFHIHGFESTNANEFATLKNYKFDFTFRKQANEKGFYIVQTTNIPEKIGLASLYTTTFYDDYIISEYIILDDTSRRVQLTYRKNIFLGDYNTYDNFIADEQLWQIGCTDNNIIWNYDFSRELFMNDFENVIIDVKD